MNRFLSTGQSVEITPVWETRALTYYLNSGANAATEKAIVGIFSKWENATRFEFEYVGRNAAGLNRDGKCTVSFVTRWPDDIPRSNIGFCRRWYDRHGHTEEADIILNMKLAEFATVRSTESPAYCLDTILSHEIGHMLGLSHIESDASVMKACLSIDDSWTIAPADDATLSAYRSLYQD